MFQAAVPLWGLWVVCRWKTQRMDRASSILLECSTGVLIGPSCPLFLWVFCCVLKVSASITMHRHLLSSFITKQNLIFQRPPYITYITRTTLTSHLTTLSSKAHRIKFTHHKVTAFITTFSSPSQWFYCSMTIVSTVEGRGWKSVWPHRRLSVLGFVFPPHRPPEPRHATQGQ